MNPLKSFQREWQHFHRNADKQDWIVIAITAFATYLVWTIGGLEG